MINLLQILQFQTRVSVYTVFIYLKLQIYENH